MNERSPGEVKNAVRTFYNTHPMSEFGVRQKLALPKKLKGKAVLDAGCGSGFFLFDYLLAGAFVTGVDQSEASIAFVRSQAEELGLSPTLIAGDLETLTLPNDSFDYIFCIYVLHHTPRPVEVLKNFRRWCKKDGEIKLIISHRYAPDVFVAWVLSGILRIFPFLSYPIPQNIKKRVHFEDRFEHPYWRQMSKGQAVAYCEAAGLTVKSAKVYGFTTFFLGYFIPPILNKFLDWSLGGYFGRAIEIYAVPHK